MKALTAPTATVTRRRWAAPIYLLQIDFTIPTAKQLLLSDAPRRRLGQDWLPLVASWGTVEDVLNTVDVGGRPATAELTLFNTKPIEGKPRISDLIRTPGNTTGTYEWAFARATVYQVFEDAQGAGDEVRLGVFYLEDPTDIDESLLSLRMTDQALVLEDKLDVVRVTRALFPAADPDAIGQVVPVPFGTLKNVPALPIVAGQRTTLRADITAASPGVGTGLPVTSHEGWPASGTLQIDEEQIAWVGLSFDGQGLPVLITAQRGANGTTPADHRTGAGVFEVLSGPKAFRYVVGENKPPYRIKSVSNIRAADVLQPQATVDLDDTTLVPGRSFAVINFPALPVVKRQVALSVADQIAVFDTISVSSPSRTQLSRFHTNLPQTMTLQFTGSAPQTKGVQATITVPPAPPGIVDVVRVLKYRITQTTAVTSYAVRRTGGAILESAGSLPLTGPREFLWSTGGVYGNETITFEASVPANSPGTLTLVLDYLELKVECLIQIDKAGSAQRAGAAFLQGNSTADVVIGDVTCDVEGLRDDASGTISGTPNLLLENPADVTKAILLACYPGVAASDLGSTFAATRARLSTFGYRWAFLLGFERFSDLRRKLGEQARSALYLEEGQWQYRFLEDTVAADVTLDYRRDVWTQMPARVSRTPRTQIRNSLWVYSQRDYRKSGALEERYARARNVADLTVFPDAIQDTLELDFVQHVGTADSLAAFWLTQWKRQRLRVELVAWWNALALDKVDYVAIANHPILEAHGGALLVFRVVGRRYRLGDEQPGRIQLSLLEIAGVTSGTAFGLPNVVLTQDEAALGWPGPKTGLLRFTELDGALADLNGLWFDEIPTRWWDDAPLGSAWFRTEGARVYESMPFDKGRVGPTPVRVDVVATATNAGGWFTDSDVATTWFQDRAGEWFDTITGDLAVTVEINLSDDGVVYGGWQPYEADAVHSFRYLTVRVTATPTVATAWVQVAGVVTTLDVPDLVHQFSEIEIGAGGTTITYATAGLTFVVIPHVRVAPLGSSAGLDPVVLSSTTTQCTVGLRDEHGALVPGIADIAVAGY